MSKIGIVVIGYNRLDSISRLIESLNKAYYNGDTVDLILSIDYSGTDVIEKYANKLQWKYGNKYVRAYREKMGLRNHVLACGNYLNEYDYDAIIVLEDDIFVAPGFYNYACQMVQNYNKEEKVAGISLYSHLWNLGADRYFNPISKGYDVYFMQYAQSWGQVWMKKQWNDFYNWYSAKAYEQMETHRIPGEVYKWPETSWLKYHIMYCIDRDKYFVYPYTSLSTNFADAGTHYSMSTNKMQVMIELSPDKKYRIPKTLSETGIYDAYFENLQLAQYVDIPSDEIVVDLYGEKLRAGMQAKYILTTLEKPYKIIKSYGLEMRPWELNVVYNVPGKMIFLYDTTIPENREKDKHLSLKHWLYDTRNERMYKRDMKDIVWNELKIKYGR